MNSHLFLASADWVGLVIFLLVILLSNLGKIFQKSGEEEPPEDFPKLPPIPKPQKPPTPAPRHPRPVQRTPQPPVVVQKPQQPRKTLEEQLQEVLKRMEQKAAPPPPPPPPIPVPAAQEVRRLVPAVREEPELPSMPRRPTRPVVQSAMSTPQQGLWYHEHLRNREAIRQAVVLREILGPPVALREE